jgi:hypothetical protein
MMDAISREHIEDAMFARMVNLRAEGSLDFNMTRETANELILKGYHQARVALTKEA